MATRRCRNGSNDLSTQDDDDDDHFLQNFGETFLFLIIKPDMYIGIQARVIPISFNET
jgi:hypothetical protein